MAKDKELRGGLNSGPTTPPVLVDSNGNELHKEPPAGVASVPVAPLDFPDDHLPPGPRETDAPPDDPKPKQADLKLPETNLVPAQQATPAPAEQPAVDPQGGLALERVSAEEGAVRRASAVHNPAQIGFVRPKAGSICRSALVELQISVPDHEEWQPGDVVFRPMGSDKWTKYDGNADLAGKLSPPDFDDHSRSRSGVVHQINVGAPVGPGLPAPCVATVVEAGEVHEHCCPHFDRAKEIGLLNRVIKVV